MKAFRTLPKVSKARAIEIAMNHNCVSREMAENYTDSELREVLRFFKLKGKFLNCLTGRWSINQENGNAEENNLPQAASLCRRSQMWKTLHCYGGSNEKLH